jgi:hypothetical protein
MYLVEQSFYLDEYIKHLIKGGYGWLVLLATIWSYGTALSIFQNYSLLYPFMISFYNGTEENNVVYSGSLYISESQKQKMGKKILFSKKQKSLDRFHVVRLGRFFLFASEHSCRLVRTGQNMSDRQFHLIAGPLRIGPHALLQASDPTAFSDLWSSVWDRSSVHLHVTRLLY